MLNNSGIQSFVCVSMCGVMVKVMDSIWPEKMEMMCNTGLFDASICAWVYMNHAECACILFFFVELKVYCYPSMHVKLFTLPASQHKGLLSPLWAK